jgi:uncharacterized protein with GYD domain
MQTYFLATKLSPSSTRDAKTIKENGRKWLEAVKRNCPGVKWLEHYALFGQYDFISVYQAPDIDTAARVSVISMSLGAQKAESWPAIPYHDFVEILDSIN